MLSTLTVRGLALLDEIELRFTPGLNAITGETGAGKSSLVSALCILSGSRCSKEQIRSGHTHAEVSGLFSVGSHAASHGALTGQIRLTRRIPRSGRAQHFINEAKVARHEFIELGRSLIEISTQNEYHELTAPSRQLQYLDAYAGSTALAAEHKRTYALLCSVTASLNRLLGEEEQRRSRHELLSFQLEELAAANLQFGEYAPLHAKARTLQRAQKHLSQLTQLRQRLTESEHPLSLEIGLCLQALSRSEVELPSFPALLDALATAQAAIEAASQHAAHVTTELEISPKDIEHMHRRLEQLEELARKHRCEPDALPARESELRLALERLQSADAETEALTAKAQALRERCSNSAKRLHAQRRRAAPEFERELAEELRALSLEEAKLFVRAQPKPAEELDAHGLTKLELAFSPNPGEPDAPLQQIASGGELSRVLLALRSVLATRAPSASFVFDEVDSGVGGRVAEAIGQRLSRIACRSQVLCVTHLPQVAAFANNHICVSKHSHTGRTLTRVRTLSSAERAEELSRMLGGCTETAREHARRLFAAASSYRERIEPGRRGKRKLHAVA